MKVENNFEKSIIFPQKNSWKFLFEYKICFTVNRNMMVKVHSPIYLIRFLWKPSGKVPFERKRSNFFTAPHLSPCLLFEAHSEVHIEVLVIGKAKVYASNGRIAMKSMLMENCIIYFVKMLEG